MGSVENIPIDESLETVLVYGTDLRETMTRWGQIMRKYNGKEENVEHNDVATNKLGYWTDNGAYYYYHTMENKSYQDTIVELHQQFKLRNIPVSYIDFDSWWYLKGIDNGVKSWTSLPLVFPDGLEYLFNQTGLQIAAHNRKVVLLSNM